MSLEQLIADNTAALKELTEVLRNADQPVTTATATVESAPAAPVEPATPATPPPVAEAPAPQVTAPTPAPAAPVEATAPFTDHQGLMAYIMGKYQSLGAEKGAQIQQILATLGFNNINDVTADKYGELHSQVEAIS